MAYYGTAPISRKEIPAMTKFRLGQIVITKGLAERMNEDTDFYLFIWVSLTRHANGDWGDICDEDKAVNEEALKDGNRLVSKYLRKDHPNDKILIITEADRSVTTVLFPSEY